MRARARLSRAHAMCVHAHRARRIACARALWGGRYLHKPEDPYSDEYYRRAAAAQLMQIRCPVKSVIF